MNRVTSIVAEVIGSELGVDERMPVLCEIVKKTEALQVRALAVLYDDAAWKESHGSWTEFCRREFGWDDSYASRMRKAAQMLLDGTPVSTEAQARALSTVPPEKRTEVLEEARERRGSEPSASDIRSVAEKYGPESVNAEDDMDEAKAEIDGCIFALRDVLKRIKALDPKGAGRWVNMPHLIADLKSAAEALKHARPHGECDEWGAHGDHCLCGGTKWLPKHVLERPKKAERKP